MKFLANIVATSIAAIVFGGGASFADAPRLDFARDARPFLDAYCAKCHNAEKSKGGINLEIFKDETSLYRHRARVEEVIEQLGRKSMPPEDARQPDDDARQKISAWLKWKLESFDPAQFHDPGYLPSHRLTRTQYRNTIRDLIGVGMEVADDLPTDEATFGFDQMGDVQEVSAVHLEKYLEAAATSSTAYSCRRRSRGNSTRASSSMSASSACRAAMRKLTSRRTRPNTRSPTRRTSSITRAASR